MPNIKSAKKRVRSNAKKENNNTVVVSSMRTAIKKFENSIKEENKDSKVLLNVAMQRVDKATKNGLVHKNKAARTKSRLTKMLNNVK